MTTAAIIECDLARNALGLSTRALDDLGGRPVIARTVERLARCPAVDMIAVVAPTAQHERMRAVLDETVRLFNLSGNDLPRRALFRRARKWALANWAGGLLGTTVFDEFGHPALVRAAEALEADVVVPVSPEWPLLDSHLLAAAVAHHRESSRPFGFTFSQAPPGVLPAIFDRSRLAEWCAQGISLGDILRYNPANPRVEYLTEPCCFQVPGEVLRCEERLAADTARGLALCRDLLCASSPQSAIRHPQSWRQKGSGTLDGGVPDPRFRPGPHPREVVIELTTRRPVNDALRPLPLIEAAELPLADALRLVRSVAQGDDTLLTLGGRGDPLLHADFPQVIAAARAAGVFGLHVVTYGRALSDGLARLFVAQGVDAVTFLLDAWTPGLYAETKGGAALAEVIAGLRRLSQARETAGADWPIPVLEFMKTARTLPEMEAFYDHWLRRSAWPVIRGPSDLSGQVEDLGVVSMAPPRRTPCRRLFRRLTVHADGRVPSCEEDVACRQPLAERLEDAWEGRTLADLRAAHIDGRLETYPLCRRCREWHRP